MDPIWSVRDQTEQESQFPVSTVPTVSTWTQPPFHNTAEDLRMWAVYSIQDKTRNRGFLHSMHTTHYATQK